MKSLLKYLKDYRKECVLGPLFKLLEASFELIVPLVVAAIVDRGIASGDRSFIVGHCAILVGLGAVGLISAVTAQFFAARAATGFATKLRYALFEQIQTLSYAELDELGTSKLIARMTGDVNAVQGMVNMVIRLFLRSPFIVFGAMVMAFTVDVKAALIFVVTIPALSVVVFGIMLISIPLYKKVQSRQEQVLKMTRENLNGTRVIRAFNREEEEIEDFNEATDALTKIQLFSGRISTLMNPLTFALVNTALVALIYVGALRVDAGSLTQGEVIALVNYMSQILVELVKLASLIIQVTKAMASASRIEEIFAVHSSMIFPEKSAKETDSEYAVEFDHVGLTYPKASAPSLSGVNLKVRCGETIGIIGGTGSGKSSLVQLICRFYDATEGCIRLDGVDVREYTKEDLRRKTGIVMQKAVLFAGTLRENIRWGREDATDEEIWEALECAQAADFVRSKGEGLELMIEPGGRNLSGGQKQRLTIARTLVAVPQILILDDSASALDYATDQALRHAIARMSGNKKLTTFIVSQRTASLRSCDRILVLEDGEVAGLGTEEELLADCEIYREIHGSDGAAAVGQTPVPENTGIGGVCHA